jgi:LysM repeat protein
VSNITDPTPTGRTPRDDGYFFGDAATPHSAPEVFRGLSPRFTPPATAPTPRVAELTQRTVKNSIPILMTGSLAAGVTMTHSIPVYAHQDSDATGESRIQKARASLQDMIASAFVPVSHQVVKTIAPNLPDTYTVRKGDTLTSVAEKFNIPTTLVLTLNGLSWNSILHEGQIVKLTTAPAKQKGIAPARTTDDRHTVAAGETLSDVATRFGISISALAQANGLSPTDQVFSGEDLIIPGIRNVDADTSLAPSSRTAGATIVFASVSDAPETADTPDSDSETNDDSEPVDLTNQDGDPVGWEIADAPKLRAPKPAPAPTPAPAPKVEVVEKKTTNTSSTEEKATTVTVEKNTSGAITPLNDTRRANASVIVQVGRDLGVPDYGIVIALATAMQESSLRNIDWGDRDSLGLFQQRPSVGWGAPEQIMDPVFATKAFFGGPSNPNPGKTRGLLDYSGWESMSLTVAAQKVQKSAYPEAYAKWEASAWAWLDELS